MSKEGSELFTMDDSTSRAGSLIKSEGHELNIKSLWRTCPRARFGLVPPYPNRETAQ